MLTLLRKGQRNKNAIDNAYVPTVTSALATSSIVSNKWRITFNVPVMVKALPTDFTVNGAAPTAFTQDSPTQVTLTYSVNVAAGQAWIVPNGSNNIRTQSGGHVAAATGTF